MIKQIIYENIQISFYRIITGREYEIKEKSIKDSSKDNSLKL